ncbi:hypothetical protein BXZ70DRAFT_532961 [Cristinia sonorae]|uniref:Uncharacterized protein n=1 Tax=Cristinia sonorae TaxID=1940300 RepID=A0A8K0UH90_9AGAR|nr:hypothetical protein BXZ70DRAFT_532961 [Cristinia sonorae]
MRSRFSTSPLARLSYLKPHPPTANLIAFVAITLPRAGAVHLLLRNGDVFRLQTLMNVYISMISRIWHHCRITLQSFKFFNFDQLEVQPPVALPHGLVPSQLHRRQALTEVTDL